MKVIVLAGGHGLRLWPLSTDSSPKQFLHFGDGESLLQKTLKRLLKRFKAQDILISTHANYADLVRSQAQAVDPNLKQLLIEPMRKNTAAALLLAVKYMQEKMDVSSDECFLVSSSDHLISPEHKLLDAFELAKIHALAGSHILFGIAPTKPETGYGYIKIGNPVGEHLFTAEKFVEKPSAQIAQTYLLEGGYLWNAGIFLFRIDSFLEDLKTSSPSFDPFIDFSLDQLTTQFAKLPELSIDYALMEHSKKVLVFPLTVSWSDIGSWDSVYEMLEKDQHQNVNVGNIVNLSTKNCLIIGGKKLIATIGLEDLMIIETEEALFIGKRGESQKVKELVEGLKK
jgi:mannose-1-phosphate guanylyltransferase/mannose-6-phosphate isomerase